MFYSVIVDISNSEVDKIFDYGSDAVIPIGSRVLVPFGNRIIEGFVIGEKAESEKATKKIIRTLDAFTAVPPELLNLMEYLKDNNIRYIDSLRLFVPSKLRGGKVKTLTKKYIYLNPEIDAAKAKEALNKNAKAQRGIIERIMEIGGGYESDFNKEFSPGAVKKLIENGIILTKNVEIGRLPSHIEAEKKHLVLSEDQEAAVNEITNGSATGYLLHGVTGSGKTEVYMSAIEKVLEKGKSAIMLVPEISLTPQMLGVFRNRFGDNVSLLHSGLSDGERYDEWLRLRLGKSKVALGARSAVFAPVTDVGIIIIDEEHDSSYVSESNPRYITSDVAAFRAAANGAKLVLGSATPSIDTYLKAKRGDLKLIELKNRVNKREMPEVGIVDMRKELRSGNFSIFSKVLLKALDETLANKNQAMIFINRRGYASFLRCQSCGYIAKCPDCDVSLTYHRDEERLKCHYCGKQFNTIDECPICGYKKLKEGRIGTEKVVSEINRIFPNAKLSRMDNDTTSTKDAYVKILSAFRRGEADILVGTQMIAKGHDFKNVTLVGILDADQTLYFSDYRSNERTFQLITQVAGRAGREQKAGKVILQTSNPNHFVFRFARDYDYKGFYEKEINSRETTKFPPFTKIVRVMILSRDEEKALKSARETYEKMKTLQSGAKDCIIRVQATRAPIKRLQTFFRFQVVLWLTQDADAIMKEIYQKAVVTAKDVTSFVEINPQKMS